MTTHERCPECGEIRVALCQGMKWRGGCPAGHYLGPLRHNPQEALKLWDRVIGAYHREQDAVREERSIPQDVARLLKKVERLENDLLPSDGAHLNTMCDRLSMLENLAATNRECRVRLANRVTKLGDRVAVLERGDCPERVCEELKDRVIRLENRDPWSEMMGLEHRIEALERRLAALERGPGPWPTDEPEATHLNSANIPPPAECQRVCHNCGKAIRADALLRCGITGRLASGPYDTCDSWEPRVPAAVPPGSPTVREEEDPVPERRCTTCDHNDDLNCALGHGITAGMTEEDGIDCPDWKPCAPDESSIHWQAKHRIESEQPKRRECWAVFSPGGEFCGARWSRSEAVKHARANYRAETDVHRMVELQRGEKIISDRWLIQIADAMQADPDERTIAKLTTDRDSLAESNARLAAEIKRLRARVEELYSTTEVGKLTEERDEWRNYHDQLQERKTELLADNGCLERKLADSPTTLAYDAQLKENERVRRQRDDALNEKERLEREAAAHLETVAELQRENARLVQLRDGLITERDKLYSELTEHERRLNDETMRLRAKLDSQTANAGESEE